MCNLNSFAVAISSRSEVVEAIVALIAVAEENAVYHRAILALGTVAKQLQEKEPGLHADIVSMLHSLLEHHTGTCTVCTWI